MMWMMKNSSGKQDSMLTFAFGGFIITCLAVILTFLGELSVGEFSFKLDLTASHVALLTLFLGSTLTAYVNRRNFKEKNEAKFKELKLRKQLGIPPSEEEEKDDV